MRVLALKRAAFGVLLGASLLSPGCSKNPEPAKGAATPARAERQDVRKEMWTCTMHPQVRQDHSGNCPICGMKLVRMADDGPRDQNSGARPEGHASFQLSPGREQLIGVTFGQVEKKVVVKTIRVAGRLAFDPELYTAQNEYVEAVSQLERVAASPISEVKHSAQRMVESAKTRLRILGISDGQIRQLAQGGGSGSSLLLTKAGQTAWVYAEVYEMDLPQIQPGQTAEISAGFLGGKSVEGKVIAVDRVINPTTRTAKVRIQVPNAKALLRPESYVDVAIRAPLGEQVVVPFDAVLDTGNQAWVFVNDGKGKYEPRLIGIKFRAGDAVAVGEGLSGGERIVTSANFLIDSESRLKGVSASDGEGGKNAAPSCPKGQHWDSPMAMCMP